MPLPTVQRALLATEVNRPLILTTTRPVPKPSASQVLLKVSVAGLNPHDQMARDLGLFIDGHYPAVLADDVAGTVVEVGPNVTKYKVGDRIVSQAAFDPTWSQMGLQEYAVSDEGAGCKIPEGISLSAAATLPTNVIAPLFGLFDKTQGLGLPAPWTEDAKRFDYQGTTILIVGGGSNCGKFATQLASIAGIGKIVVVGGDSDELTSYGATHVLDRHGGQDVVLQRVQEVVGDDLEYAFDAVNPAEEQLLAINAFSSTKKGKLSRLVSVGEIDKSKVQGNRHYDLMNVYGLSQHIPELAFPFWNHVPKYLVSGKLKPGPFVVKQGLTPENANSVLDLYRDGKKVTKTHLHF
jgi:NADPH2:quinone reductase